MAVRTATNVLEPILEDEQFRSEFIADRESVMKRFDLTSEDESMLRELDVTVLMSGVNTLEKTTPEVTTTRFIIKG